MTYKYIIENQLLNPCNYHYSQFEGIDFIRQYINNRLIFLNKIRLNLDANKNKSKIYELDWLIFINEYLDNINQISISEVLKFNSQFRIKRKQFNKHKSSFNKANIDSKENADSKTAHILKKIIEHKFSNLNKSENMDITLIKFIHKYEIKKKVYQYHNQNIKPSFWGSDQNIDNYVLLSSAIALSLKGNCLTNLKYLNCLLKINDLLLSIFEKYLSNDILLNHTFLSLMLELENVMVLGNINDKIRD